MCCAPFLPLPPDLPLLVAMTLAPAEALCGLWLAPPGPARPFPLQLATPAGWRALLIGADLGALLTVVESVLVDAGDGPRCVPSPVLRRARCLELRDGAGSRVVSLHCESPEALLLAEPAVTQSRIRYLG